MTDSPSPTGIAGVISDAEWMLDVYEPRMQTDGIDIDATLSGIGEFGMDASIKRREVD
jgi:hypothetical protein